MNLYYDYSLYIWGEWLDGDKNENIIIWVGGIGWYHDLLLILLLFVQ